jgi:hypothetical protein
MKYSTIRSFHVSLDLNLDRGTERNTNVFLGCLIFFQHTLCYFDVFNELLLTAKQDSIERLRFNALHTYISSQIFILAQFTSSSLAL